MHRLYLVPLAFLASVALANNVDAENFDVSDESTLLQIKKASKLSASQQHQLHAFHKAMSAFDAMYKAKHSGKIVTDGTHLSAGPSPAKMLQEDADEQEDSSWRIFLEDADAPTESNDTVATAQSNDGEAKPSDDGEAKASDDTDTADGDAKLSDASNATASDDTDKAESDAKPSDDGEAKASDNTADAEKADGDAQPTDDGNATASDDTDKADGDAQPSDDGNATASDDTDKANGDANPSEKSAATAKKSTAVAAAGISSIVLSVAMFNAL